MLGKQVRLERIVARHSGRTVIIPMDHGTTVGPIPGLSDMRNAVQMVVDGGANAIIAHKGMVGSGHRRRGGDIGLIVHLNASTTLGLDPNAKVMVCTVEEAIKMGADAVSIHVNLGANTEPEMLRCLGAVSGKCAEWGMPLVAMMYTRGPKITDQYDVKYTKHAARVGAELGADIVKCVYTGSPETFGDVVEGCPVPVVIAGGEKMETDREILEMVAGSLEAGGKGVSIGRNAFQHERPDKMVAAIAKLVHEDARVDDALAFLQAD
ncbi:MAG: 2-amino-3,7-dideoxy-D-threo-hept-6-ulosonate synthase [Planctomycetota bacterium]